ncbi:MAG TPA: replication initiator protein A, partial [Pirellulales bacterium]|nr:replication initiator protein A [Pirellulales bacterium]
GSNRTPKRFAITEPTSAATPPTGAGAVVLSDGWPRILPTPAPSPARHRATWRRCTVTDNLLRSIRRTTGGKDYIRLRAALERLAHTAVRTNIRANGKKKFTSFHWLDSWQETVDEATGEPIGMTITLPNWLYEGITEQGLVLTIHEDYFLLTGGIERWLYRVARKHAGNQIGGWSFTMRQLFEKSGSSARPSDFAIDIRQVVEANQLPEYELSLERNGEGDEIIRFVHRAKLPTDHPHAEYPRFPGRCQTPGKGIYAEAWKFNDLSQNDTGE